jgi:hypothetical protein
MPRFTVYASYTIPIGTFEAETSDKAVKQADQKMNDIAWNLGVDEPDNIYTEFIE